MKMFLFRWFGFLLFVLCSLPETTGQSNLISSHQPIVAVAGDDVVLPCRLDPPISASTRAVEWTRPGSDPEYIHVHQEGRLVHHSQNPLYRYRTALFVDQLINGNVSLKLFRVKASDAGKYRCFLPSLWKEAFIQLNIAPGAVSSPSISLVGLKSSRGVVLDCESRGWYPEPEVLWLDAEGNLLSAGPTETVRGPDDLYTVSSRVTVEKRHSNSFTCRVHQKSTNQTRDTHVRLSADLFMVQSSSAIRISICLVVSIVPVVAVVLVVWKCGRNKKQGENRTELQLLMDGERHREKFMTKRENIAYLDKTKGKLDEDLQNNEGELNHVEQVINTLINQKKDLKNQREKLTSLQQQNKTQIEENKKKINNPPKTDKENKMKKRKENAEILQKREEELKELLQNTDTLVESTEQIINTMTLWKGKVERDKEKINKLLKEIERQKEEIQKKLQEESEREEEINPPIPMA